MKVGILGAGQLGRMLALAGYPLGLEFVFYDRDPEACAGQVGKLVVGEFDDKEKLTTFAQQVDIVTVEFENIPMAALKHVAQYVPVYPNPDAINVAQDRFIEKQFFKSLGIPTPEFYAVGDAAALADVVAIHRDGLVLKSRRLGYDGKGQLLVDSSASAADAWASLGQVPLIAEQRMKFAREVSIIAVRDHRGDFRFYPLIDNLHKKGILKRSEVSLHDSLQAKAEDYAQRVLTELNYVGVLALEFFDVDGELVANEMAPRVHNSGHWTIEGAITSQFENHLRAILNWPLGDTHVPALCTMFNVIGDQPDTELLLKVPDAYFHSYGKEARSGRKLGHVTLLASTEQNAMAIEDILNGHLESDLITTVVHRRRSVM